MGYSFLRFAAALMLVLPISISGYSYAQNLAASLNEISFASQEDRSKFEALPREVQEKVLNRDPGPPPSQEIIAKAKVSSFHFISQKLRLDLDSREANFLKDRILGEDPKIENPVGPGNKVPLEHLRFKGGKPFPNRAEIVRAESSQLAIAKQRRENRIRTKAREQRRVVAVKQPEPVKVISKPKCTQSTAATLEMPENFIAAGQAVDLLFFDGQPPFDVKTGIGAATVVIPFGLPETAEAVSPFGSLDIQCLPFRLKSTGKKVYYGMGSMALKNFDANPEAEGTFDPTVRRYIEQSGLEK